MKDRIDKVLDSWTKDKNFRCRLFLEGILVGLGSGVTVGLFRYLLQLAEQGRPWVYEQVRQSLQAGELGWVLGYIACFLVAAVLLSKLVHHEPMCTGSGIPQIKGILLGKMYMRWYSVLVAKILGGVLAIGAGMSLGREGPSVQIGASAGQGVSRSLGRTRFEERFLMTAGSGAGLAAAFNAPLAGVIFGMEELQKSFSPLLLMASITAAVTATTVTQVFFGMSPVFHVGSLPVLPIEQYGILIGFGVVMGLVGRLFNPALLYALGWYEKAKLTGVAKPLLPLSLAAILGFVLPEILGGGHLLVDMLVEQNFALGFLLLLVVGKFLFTMVCFGSGVPGGIFLPMLVLGAGSGAVFSKLLVMGNLLPELYAGDIIVFGMAAYFAAVVKSPVTGSVLIMEMTGSFTHMLPLICVSMVAYLVADLTGGKPVYDELLNRSLAQRNRLHSWEDSVSNHRLALELTIHSGSYLAGKEIQAVQWPAKTVIVEVRRGMYRLVPKGNLTLQEGDYLYVMTEDTSISPLEKMCQEPKI